MHEHPISGRAALAFVDKQNCRPARSLFVRSGVLGMVAERLAGAGKQKPGFRIELLDSES